MPRIIAGSAGGRPLQAPPGRVTRPTADRVKEALFSALEADPGIAGRRVLDLYAGSGALGLEAASRGAATVTLVENNQAALRALRRNVAATALPGVQVIAAGVATWLGSADPGEPYDIALLDPPYAVAVDPVLHTLADRSWLTADAVVVVERASRDAAIRWPAGVRQV